MTEGEILKGSGNVYQDLGYPNADEMLVKAKLAYAIDRILQEKRLTQQRAAKIIGMPQSKLSSMLNGQFRGISAAKMMDCLARLGRDVNIVVGRERPRRKRPARVGVTQEA